MHQLCVTDLVATLSMPLPPLALPAPLPPSTSVLFASIYADVCPSIDNVVMEIQVTKTASLTSTCRTRYRCTASDATRESELGQWKKKG